jgi:NTP pyrophosphatase (non-canonical NTP hydrolase)
MEKDLNKLIEFITKLSLADKKTLSQKAGKITEENGELARAILSHENASGFKDKLSNKENILEECCDIILSAISIPLAEGYKFGDIYKKLHDKSLYWEQKQIKEEKAEFPLWFEIHVTIKRPENINSYVEFCKSIEVKPIVLDLQNGGGTVMKDVMTSSKHYGDNTSVLNECERISKELKTAGYNVIRKKIECVPWHPKAPRRFENNPVMPKDCYFESHIGVTIDNEEKQIESLDAISFMHQCHLSQNFFKKNIDGTYVIMLTYRDYEGTLEDFNEKIEQIKSSLDEYDLKYEKVITEFSIYDTKISHDSEWLKD